MKKASAHHRDLGHSILEQGPSREGALEADSAQDTKPANQLKSEAFYTVKQSKR